MRVLEFYKKKYSKSSNLISKQKTEKASSSILKETASDLVSATKFVKL